MLPSLSDVYEEIIPSTPLLILIGLNLDDNRLLAELGGLAKSTAPLVSKALAARILEFTNLSARNSISSDDVQLYLQDWILQLFHCREEKYLEFQEYFLGIPLDLVLTGLDLILSFGREVSAFSSQPEKAALAFEKALAFKIAHDRLQWQEEQAQHIYDLMLLD